MENPSKAKLQKDEIGPEKSLTNKKKKNQDVGTCTKNKIGT